MNPTAVEASASETSSNDALGLAFQETTDAGETLGTAVPIVADQAMPLNSIAGSLAGDADVFQIFISGDEPFSATTLNRDTLLELPIDNLLGIPTDFLEDPQLFLFDALGNGIVANDDLFGSSQATLPSSDSLSLAPGIYYLAISSFDFDPVSAGGEIFVDTSANGILTPTGPGGNSPLTGFAGDSQTSGSYVISLTGATTVPQLEPNLIGLTDNNQLVLFNSSQPSQTQTIPVIGLDGTLLGIDSRPANGLIYGLTTTNQIYTLAIGSDQAVATLVSTLSTPFEGGQISGVDFNPVPDRLRVVGSNDQNFRINVDTGQVMVDTPLAFAATDANAGVDPNVTAAAYINSFGGATSTTLYDIDSELDTLFIQSPPNDGTLVTVGSLGVDFDNVAGFDILSSPVGTNQAFAVSNATLYSIDLMTGQATSLGDIGIDDSVNLVGFTAQLDTFRTAINFDRAGGVDLAAGTVITDQFAGLGLQISTSGLFGAMIFDTANPTGGDQDLASDTLGKVLIISEDGDSSDPDDAAIGGILRFEFDDLVNVESVGLLDIEERGSTVTLFDESGAAISTIPIPSLGDNSFQQLAINVDQVASVEVFFTGSGAVTDLNFLQPVMSSATV